MIPSRKSCRYALILGAFLTTSFAHAEEPRSRTTREVHPEARASLAASIARRESEMALRERKEILAEVEKRTQDLELDASAEELTDLLVHRAYLEIETDKCRLAGEACRRQKVALANLEARFREKTGLSTREFRSGQRDNPALDAERAGLTGRPGSGPRNAVLPMAGETCTCAFSVYSQDRWMNRYWGLECNNHSGHGVCSNDLDWAHSPGTGAMTGDIYVYFGFYNDPQHRECPDDHRTCFKGPSTDHVGAWGNACNCDTWHSQYSNPFLQWYGGDLTDSEVVYQMSTTWLGTFGSCDGATVSVKEFIKENDPFCCDDPMGDLWVTLPLTNGYGTVTGATSAQNCNGGSQSGVYPNCGTFGATIRVDYNCSTYTPPPCDPDGSMAEQCANQGGPYMWDSDACTCRCIGSYSICPPE